MKKIIITILLSIVFFFVFTKVSSAACVGIGNAANCPRGQIRCSVGGADSCCDQAGGGCAQLQGSTQVTGGTTNGTVTGGGAAPVSVLCGTGIRTAIGCIPVMGDTTGTAFTSYILKWALGFGSGIAFLLILYGGFIVMTSTGNPERLKAGQELLTSAIGGLLLLVFCVFLLNFIGVNILGIFS